MKKVFTCLLSFLMAITVVMACPSESDAAIFTKYYEIKYNGKIAKLPVNSAKKYTTYYISDSGTSIGAVYRDPYGKDSRGNNLHKLAYRELGAEYVYTGRTFVANGLSYFEMIPIKQVGSIYVIDSNKSAIGIRAGYFTKYNKEVVIGNAYILKSSNLNPRFADSFSMYVWNGNSNSSYLSNMVIGDICFYARSNKVSVKVKTMLGLMVG